MTRPDVDRLRRSLSPASRRRIERIDAFASIDSTNTWLTARPPPQPGAAAVAIAGHQTAGRGRRERRWVSSPGSSLCLSLAYTFCELPARLPPLTLAIGVATAGALERLGIEGVRVKWPNDLLLGRRKLGGILVESRILNADPQPAVTVIAGIGINLEMPRLLADAIDSDWDAGPVGLDACGVELPGRDVLAAALIDAIVDAMLRFDAEGLPPFATMFARLDGLAGCVIVAETPDGTLQGVADGIDNDGALRLVQRDGVRRIVSGSIRIDDKRVDAKRAV